MASLPILETWRENSCKHLYAWPILTPWIKGTLSSSFVLVQTGRLYAIHDCLHFVIFHTSSLRSLGSVPYPAFQILCLEWQSFRYTVEKAQYHSVTSLPHGLQIEECCTTHCLVTLPSVTVRSNMLRLYWPPYCISRKGMQFFQEKLRQHRSASFHITARPTLFSS